MNCNCKKVYDSILKAIGDKKKEFEIAYGLGTNAVRQVKFQVLKNIYTELKGKEKCNCFLGRNVQIMQELIVTFIDNMDTLKRDINHTAFENEKDKVFDKINLLLNTR